MNKYVKYGIIGILTIGILYAMVHFLKKNSTPTELYKTESLEAFKSAS